LPVDLGNFVLEETTQSPATGSSDDDEARAPEADDDFEHNPRQLERTFRCATTTAKSGSAVSLHLKIRVEEISGVRHPHIQWTIEPYTLKDEYLLTDTDLTFVLKRHIDETAVEDIRLYIKRRFRGRGFGHLLLCFIKAYFFPFWVRFGEGDGDDTRVCNLPVGGSWGIERLTTLPSKESKQFYTQQGFSSFSSAGFSKWQFWPDSEEVVGPVTDY
jgi:GNAT superfamily N-acetyltransferase